MTRFPQIPTMAEIEALRRGKPIEKGKSRLESKADEKKYTIVDERAFTTTVWTRDKNRCRCCERKVLKTLSLVPERGEVHHCNGRRGDLRFEDRAALLLCSTCHGRVTGRINDRLFVVPTRKFLLHGESFTDARFPVRFVPMTEMK